MHQAAQSPGPIMWGSQYGQRLADPQFETQWMRIGQQQTCTGPSASGSSDGRHAAHGLTFDGDFTNSAYTFPSFRVTVAK